MNAYADLALGVGHGLDGTGNLRGGFCQGADELADRRLDRARKNREGLVLGRQRCQTRSEEHTSELQSLMRISYAVFCLQKNKSKKPPSETIYNASIKQD